MQRGNTLSAEQFAELKERFKAVLLMQCQKNPVTMFLLGTTLAFFVLWPVAHVIAFVFWSAQIIVYGIYFVLYYLYLGLGWSLYGIRYIVALLVSYVYPAAITGMIGVWLFQVLRLRKLSFVRRIESKMDRYVGIGVSLTSCVLSGQLLLMVLQFSLKYTTELIIAIPVLLLTVILCGAWMVNFNLATLENLAAAVTGARPKTDRPQPTYHPPASETPQTGTEQNMCTICFEYPKSVLILPCRHFCLCTECIDRLDPMMCPICRKRIEDWERIYPQ